MRWKQFGKMGLTAAALAASAALVLPVSAATAPANPAQQARQASALLRGIGLDAKQIEAHALRIERLSSNAKPAWHAYDRQWNKIKPAVEIISMRLHRLEAIQAALPASDQKALASSRPLFGEIETTTREVRTLLDSSATISPQSTSALKQRSEAMAKAARELVQTAG
jgi:hypothetical protein